MSSPRRSICRAKRRFAAPLGPRSSRSPLSTLGVRCLRARKRAGETSAGPTGHANCLRKGFPSVSAIEVRKRIVTVEDIFHEGGQKADAPYRRGAILSVIKNPFAGRYVENILGFSD